MSVAIPATTVMIRSRLAPFAALGAVWLSACLPSVAHAAISVMSKPAATGRVTEARVAYARGNARSTLWTQLRLDGAADEVLVIAPLPEGAVLDLGQVNLLDAIEEATAPRLRPPTDEPPSDLFCKLPKDLVVVTSGDTAAPLSPNATRVALSADEAVTICEEWGFEGCTEQKAGLAQSAGDTGRFVLMRFEPPTGKTATPLFRLNGPKLDRIAMQLLQTDASLPVPLTLWLIGTGRGSVEGAVEHELPSPLGRWTSSSQSTYASERWQQLTSAEGNALFVESAGNEAFKSTQIVPGVGVIPGLVSTYLARASALSFLGFSPSTSAEIFKLLSKTERFADACPHAEQGAGDDQPACEEIVGEGESSSAPLAPLGNADDLRFVFGGDVKGRWVTRLVGQIPSGSSLPALSPMFQAGGGVSSVKQSESNWSALCTSNAPSQGGYGGATSGHGAGSSYSGGGGPGPYQGAGGTQIDDGHGYDDGYDDGYVDGATATSNHVDVSCVGSIGSSDDGCSSDDSGYADDGCSSSDDSSYEDDGCSSDDGGYEDDGCSSGDDASGSDACDGSSSSSGGDACDGSSSGGGDACSGGGSGGDCTIGRGRGRGRSKMSRVTMLLTALVLPLRRYTRRPRSKRAR